MTADVGVCAAAPEEAERTEQEEHDVINAGAQPEDETRFTHTGEGQLPLKGFKTIVKSSKNTIVFIT